MREYGMWRTFLNTMPDRMTSSVLSYSTRNDRWRATAINAAGIRNSIIQTSQFAGTRPKPPSAPPDEERPATSTSRPGTAKALRLPANANRIEIGWSRCSDGIVASRKKLLADTERARVLEAAEAHAAPARHRCAARGSGVR